MTGHVLAAAETGGVVDWVTEEEVSGAVRLLARTGGILTETAGGATAGVLAEPAGILDGPDGRRIDIDAGVRAFGEKPAVS